MGSIIPYIQQVIGPLINQHEPHKDSPTKQRSQAGFVEQRTQKMGASELHVPWSKVAILGMVIPPLMTESL